MRYTLSAWIKAARPGTRVTLRFFEWADDGGDQPSNRNERQATVAATTDWARYQVSGIALPNLWEDYVARIVPAGTVWLDDVQIEEGEATGYRPAQAIEVGTETPRAGAEWESPSEATAHVASAGPLGNCPLSCTLEDLWSRPVRPRSRTATPGVAERVSFTPKRPGMYRVRMRAGDSPATGEVWFGVFPIATASCGPTRCSARTSRQSCRSTNTLLASEAMARWVRLRFRRLLPLGAVVERRKGRFVWRDAEIDDLPELGLMYLQPR